MKGVSIEKLVYTQLFPKARATDPEDFDAFLNRHLIAEIKSETLAFYGQLETLESKYPGLDYTNRTHRIRLSRYTWHRRLFRALDALGLTPAEISNLSRWQGTKWAKEKYEKETGVEIRDTAADGIPTWDDELGRAVGDEREVSNNDEEAASQDNAQEEEESSDADNNHDQGQEARGDAQGDEEASESEFRSVGVELNRRLLAGAARREAGDVNAVLDEEWEQWLKHIVDNGLLYPNIASQRVQEYIVSTLVPSGLVPVDTMSAAREGRWSEIPEYLHAILRLMIQAEQREQAIRPADDEAPGAHSPASSSVLRRMLGNSRPGRVTADAPGA